MNSKSLTLTQLFAQLFREQWYGMVWYGMVWYGMVEVPPTLAASTATLQPSFLTMKVLTNRKAVKMYVQSSQLKVHQR